MHATRALHRRESQPTHFCSHCASHRAAPDTAVASAPAGEPGARCPGQRPGTTNLTTKHSKLGPTAHAREAGEGSFRVAPPLAPRPENAPASIPAHDKSIVQDGDDRERRLGTQIGAGQPLDEPKYAEKLDPILSLLHVKHWRVCGRLGESGSEPHTPFSGRPARPARSRSQQKGPPNRQPFPWSQLRAKSVADLRTIATHIVLADVLAVAVIPALLANHIATLTSRVA